MSILSTNKKLIKVGAEYSAGSGISIDDYVISVTGDVGKTYSAGDNIGIYTQDNQLYISGKDWEQDIANASANAYEQAVAQIPQPQDLSFISAQVDNKLNSSDFTDWQNGQYTTDLQTIEGQINNKLDSSSFSDVSGNFLTAINIPESATWNDTSNVVKEGSASWNQGKTYEGISPIVVNNDENVVSADTWTFSAGNNVSFVDDNVNKITRIDVTAQGGDAQVNSFVYENSAKINDVNSSYQSNSGTFLTAAPANMATTGDVAELAQTISETYQVKGDYLTTADSANFYPTNNPSSFATENWVTAQGYITGVDLSEYAKRAFVLSSIESATSGKLDVSSFASVSSDFLTNEDLNGYATESFVENVSGDITALIPSVEGLASETYVDEQVSGKADKNEIPDTSNFITNASAEETYQPIGNYLSSNALNGYATEQWVSEQGYLTGINIPQSANWNDTSTVVRTNSSVWNDKLDVSSLDLSFGNPDGFGYGITGAYKISGADILANYALADSQGRYITGWYQLKDDNLLSGTKYGTLRIDNENTHLVDTTFSALSSYNGVEISAIPESGVGFYNGGIFPDNTKSTTSHNYDNVLSYSINIQSWDGGFTAQINGTNYDHSYFDGSHTITGEFNTPSTLNVKLSRGNNYMNPQINQFDLGVEGQVNEVVDIRNVFATTGDLSSKQDSLTFGYDEQDRINSINNSALAGGGDVPEGVMVEPNLEYNAVGEISGYGNSAIAQYGAEKQWLVHDDTLVHAANSAQYALGVNLSAVAQLLGVDETVLWTNAKGILTATGQNFVLNESYKNFNKFKFCLDMDDCKQEIYVNITNNTTYGFSWGQTNSTDCYLSWMGINFSTDTTGSIVRSKALSYTTNTTAVSPNQCRNNWEWTCRALTAIYGIGRKA